MLREVVEAFEEEETFESFKSELFNILRDNPQWAQRYGASLRCPECGLE